MSEALTKEERSRRIKQRTEERRREEKEQEEKYPSARLSDDKRWVQVVLDSEEPGFLTIRIIGDHLRPERGCESVRCASIRLDNLQALARLIRGLTLRYNSMIKDLNCGIEKTPPLELAKTLEVSPPGEEA